MKRLFSATLVMGLGLASAPAWANLLTNGTFDSGALTSTFKLDPIGGTLNAWVANGTEYTLAAGPSGNYAKHNVSAGGQDQKLVQFVSGSGLAGGKLELYFDYIYDSSGSAESNPQAYVSLIGITANRAYELSGGTGVDGLWSGGDYAVAAPDILLAQAMLDFTNGAWRQNQLLSSGILSANYFAIGVIIQSGCYDSLVAADCNNLRGVDNFRLNRVPEPGTLALLGLGLAGLGLSRRRKTH